MENNVKILVVEDEPIMALELKNAIQKLGYLVTDCVSNYQDALNSIHIKPADIVFMDINLEGDKDGIETAIAIQSKCSEVAIIYLTAFSDDQTIARAIQTDPAHYMFKPYKRTELKSTILLALFKMKNNQEVDAYYEHTAIGYDYYFDLKNDNLFYKSETIKLGVKEKQFLRILIEAEDGLVTFSRLETLIWGNNTVSMSAYRTLVYRLRAKLGQKLIVSVPSFGYKLK